MQDFFHFISLKCKLEGCFSWTVVGPGRSSRIKTWKNMVEKKINKKFVTFFQFYFHGKIVLTLTLGKKTTTMKQIQLLPEAALLTSKDSSMGGFIICSHISWQLQEDSNLSPILTISSPGQSEPGDNWVEGKQTESHLVHTSKTQQLIPVKNSKIYGSVLHSLGK